MSTTPRSRRSFLAAAAAAAATPLVTGACSAGGSAADGTTTVTVMYQASEFSPEQVAAFEAANTDLRIEFIESDETRLNAMLTAGNPPDFVRGNPSANLFARGLAEPLDDYIAKSSLIHDADLAAPNDLWRWNGTERGSGPRYGLLKDFSPDTTIWQNTAVFEAAGVEPYSTTGPSNWDDVLAKAVQLKAAGVVEHPLGIEWQWGVSGIVQTMVGQQGGQVFSDDLKTAQLNTPEAVRAIQWLIDYGTAGVGPTSLNPLADGSDAATYLSGRMAATLDGFWFGGNFAGDDGRAVGATSSLVPAPTFGDRFSPIFGGVGGWIPVQAKNKDAGWRVMEWFLGGQPAVDRAGSGWGLPALKSLWADIPATEPHQQEAIALAQQEVEFVTPLQDSPYITFAQWNDALDEGLQKGIKGEATAAEIAAGVQATMQTALDQGIDQLG